VNPGRCLRGWIWLLRGSSGGDSAGPSDCLSKPSWQRFAAQVSPTAVRSTLSRARSGLFQGPSGRRVGCLACMRSDLSPRHRTAVSGVAGRSPGSSEAPPGACFAPLASSFSGALGGGCPAARRGGVAVAKTSSGSGYDGPRRPAQPRRTTADQPRNAADATRAARRQRPEAPSEPARVPRADPARPASPSPWAASEARWRPCRGCSSGPLHGPRNAPPPDPDKCVGAHLNDLLGLQHERLDEEATPAAAAVAEEETGLVADDVVRFGPGAAGRGAEALPACAGRARAEYRLWAASAPAETEVPRCIRHLCGALSSTVRQRTDPTPRGRSIAGYRRSHFNGHLGIRPRAPSRPREKLIPALARLPFHRQPKVSTAIGLSRVTAMKYPTGGHVFSPAPATFCP
jgi:hypothetical protein